MSRVLRSSHLSAGDREICKYAVLLVFVSGVRFQALKCWRKNNEKLIVEHNHQQRAY